MYPYNHKMGQRIQTDAKGTSVDRGFIAHIQSSPLVSSNTAVHAAIISTASQQVITTAISNPDIPRNITATAGGTATDIKAIQVTIEGTNYNDEIITEVLPAFTVDTAGTVQGNKAFKTITKITIPAHDGTGATTSIGFGNKLGIPYKLAHNTVLAAYLNNVKESNAPTVTTSATVLENNTLTLNSSLNGNVVDAYLIV